MPDEQAEHEADRAASDFRELFLHMRAQSKWNVLMWLQDAGRQYGGQLILEAPASREQRVFTEAKYSSR